MYIGNDLSRGRSETYYYTSTSGGETSITTDSSGKTINYTVGWVSVYLNGVRLHDSDFTATTGNSITGLAALTQDDVVIIEAQHTFSSSDAVPSTGGTFSGNVSFGDNNITNVGDISLDTISSDAGTSIGVTLGTDAGDDFNVGSGKLLVEGDTGLVTFGAATTTTGDATHNGNIIMATNKKIKQKGEAYIHSSHQSWVLGG